MADGIKVKMDIRSAMRGLRKQGPLRQRAARKVLAKYALLMQGEAKINLRDSPRRIDTGLLWNSIEILLVALGAQIFTRNEYAGFVHWGTGVHGENPKGGHRLTPWIYKDEKTGQFHVTTGMEPNMFLKNAWDKYVDPYAVEMRKVWKKSDTSEARK